ncbi:RnfABCDGE type electron transport complex subunit D [Kaarinaea lacus]
MIDPRSYQITVLATLLACGIVFFDFALQYKVTIAIVATALLTQWGCTRFWQLPVYDPRSALISSLSLCLLLRTDWLWVAVVAAFVTIISKFIIRVNNKHIFNPTNFGIAFVLIVLGDHAWVSPGQWGTTALFGFFLACMGLIVVYRAQRSDITIAFLLAYSGIVMLRGMWLGDPMAVAWHHLQNGAFLLFAFFMISDPKTTPDARIGRVLHATVVAIVAAYVHFVLYQPNGFIWALVCCAPLVALWDKLFKAERYTWEPVRNLRKII